MADANPRRYTLADAVRDDFERRHPGGKNTLLCVGLCRRRRDREDFRETPWHGRAADCRTCEGGGWEYERAQRTYWELAQAREKLRAYQRYARALRFRLLLKSGPTSAEALTVYEKPLYDALERAVSRQVHAWASVVGTVLREAESDV
ncbi:hypothetical protein [Streptomyces sp. NRRL S-378]|uniref:hypothetical protein n=1 Tax=Streptomyces sp. NRRL S-378 TaxID=1463904 RepID=UPI000B2AF1A5|nr:hypothetical protein [Streptomyces sp. NRRL S-378]